MLQIEDGVPMPTPSRGEIYRTIDAMEVGQSFVVHGNIWSARQSIYNHHRKYPGKHFQTLRLGNGALRVWRVM